MPRNALRMCRLNLSLAQLLARPIMSIAQPAPQRPPTSPSSIIRQSRHRRIITKFLTTCPLVLSLSKGVSTTLHYSPSPPERTRGEGQVEAWRALAGPILPDADAKTAIRAGAGMPHPGASRCYKHLRRCHRDWLSIPGVDLLGAIHRRSRSYSVPHLSEDGFNRV
jgi:hypothetical protein